MVGNKCSTGEFVSGSVVMRGGGLSIVEGFAEIVGISFASNCINSNDQRQLWWGSDHYWGEGFGGAFFFAEMSSVYVHRSSFFNNSATSGGGVYVALQSSDENQVIAFSHCDFLCVSLAIECILLFSLSLRSFSFQVECRPVVRGGCGF